jgi:hypothetical protein
MTIPSRNIVRIGVSIAGLINLGRAVTASGNRRVEMFRDAIFVEISGETGREESSRHA